MSKNFRRKHRDPPQRRFGRGATVVGMTEVCFFTPTRSSRRGARLTQLTQFRPEIISVVYLQFILTKQTDRDSAKPGVGLILVYRGSNPALSFAGASCVEV